MRSWMLLVCLAEAGCATTPRNDTSAPPLAPAPSGQPAKAAAAGASVRGAAAGGPAEGERPGLSITFVAEGCRIVTPGDVPASPDVRAMLAAAGLQVGDVLLAVDGAPCRGPAELGRALGGHSRIRLRRSGKVVEVGESRPL